ncbi:MAG: L-histidine N(alpha)-methyltransferase [Nitrospinae bacterium]|nr:L-histidine N(alpha)-methyltransferase [Nitrospinota bacterium]
MTFNFKNLRPNNNSNSPDQEFAQTVLEGLSKERKILPSWLIFDDRGSEIFQEIVELKNYHPAVCEFEIFHTHKQTFTDIISNETLQIIDLGSGDARKTMVLLEHLMKSNLQVHYIPIDISAGAIKKLVTSLELKFSNTSLTVTGIASEYFQGLEAVSREQFERNFVFFLGSTIGNQDYPAAGKFVRRLWDSLNEGDYVMIGFDLMKNPKLLYSAYNDPEGVFQKFNLHLLDRINQKLGADFVKQNYVQEGHYNERSRAVESHIYSTVDQTVCISALNKEFHFKLWEGMQTEHSYKYTVPEIEALAQNNGFAIVEHLFDSKKFFVDSIWKVKK